MALGDLMVSRLSHTSVSVVTNHHYNGCANTSSHVDCDLAAVTGRRDSETANSSTEMPRQPPQPPLPWPICLRQLCSASSDTMPSRPVCPRVLQKAGSFQNGGLKIELLVTAFSSIQGHKPGVRNLNAVVDWQQQSGYLYASGEVSSIMLWDLEKEQLVNSIPSYSDISAAALMALSMEMRGSSMWSASQVHGGQLATGFMDGSVRLHDVRTPDMLVCASRPHTQKVGRVVGLSFQPGLDPAKIVSASQAGDIQFLDIRNHKDTYHTFDAHRGSLTTLAVHRHAPIIASGSAKQLIKVFSLQGEQLGIIRYYPSFMAQKIGSVSCLTFHPYQVLLAAGAADSFVSVYTDDNAQAR